MGYINGTTVTTYGIADEEYSHSPLDDNTLKILVGEHLSRSNNYNQCELGTFEEPELIGMEIGPDFDESEVLAIFNGQNRRSLDIFIPNWVDQEQAMVTNHRLAMLHVRYRQQFESVLTPIN
jgi:hypothetical protein